MDQRGPGGLSGGTAPSAQATESGGAAYANFRPLEGRTASREPPPGPVLVDRYVVERELGHGGDGTVYLALDRVGASQVAIKRFDGRSGGRVAGGLLRELRLGRAVNHPNVCRVFDVFEADGRWFLTMEYAAGEALRALVGEGARQRPFAERLADALAVVDGVAAIHAAGFLHRDIKPENVLRMQDGRLVVSDFGLSRPAAAATLSSGAAGTPGYLAPEVAMGDEATVASDVYALGVLIHEVFFGTRPPRGLRERGRVPGDLRRAMTHAERRIAELCGRCLSSAPTLRPASARDLGQSLKAIAMKGGSRRRVAIGTASLLLVGVLLATTWSGSRRASGTAAPPPVGTVTLSGEAADWSHSTVLLKAETTCLQALPPERKVVRAITSDGRAVEIDLDTGSAAPSAILAETYATGCPQTSPDGSSLMFQRAIAQGKYQIMLSPRPDGGDANVVTIGSSPTWLPSGLEFLMRIEGDRVAVGNLKGERIPLPAPLDSSAALFLNAAVSDSGDRIAVPFLGVGPPRIEIYSYPQLTRLQSTLIRDARLFEGSFDSARQRFQFTVREQLERVAAELTPDGRLVRLGRIPNGEVVRLVRTGRGVVFASNRNEHSRLVLRAPDGSEHPIATDVVWASTSATGDVVFNVSRPDRTQVIGIRRARDSSPTILTDGPTDQAPDMSRDGTSITYLRAKTGEIVHCGVAQSSIDGCRVVHTDPDANVYLRLRLSPDGNEIVYVSGIASPRSLRVISLTTGRVRDLGPTTGTCPFRWASSSTIWMRPSYVEPWIEIDSSSARPTGKTWKAVPSRESPCGTLPPDGNPYRVRVDWDSVAEVRLLKDI